MVTAATIFFVKIEYYKHFLIFQQIATLFDYMNGGLNFILLAYQTSSNKAKVYINRHNLLVSTKLGYLGQGIKMNVYSCSNCAFNKNYTGVVG